MVHWVCWQPYIKMAILGRHAPLHGRRWASRGRVFILVVELLQDDDDAADDADEVTSVV